MASCNLGGWIGCNVQLTLENLHWAGGKDFRFKQDKISQVWSILNAFIETARFLQRMNHRLFKQRQTIIKHMNTLAAKGNWNIAKGKLKQKFAQLTDDDLQFMEGKQDELIGRIQKLTGQTREDIARAVSDCCALNQENAKLK